jgi:branched-subunit amino acid aminotransferase/4-amino-4-deoxychorismate lyase
MHQFVLFNHRILSASETNISALSSAALYGRGIFTTLAIYHSKPFLWANHWRRLTENAEKVGIDLSSFSEESVKHSLFEMINRNCLTDGRARLTIFDERPSQIWSFDSEKKTNLLITTAESRETAEIRLTVSPFHLNSASPLVNVKSCNYLENLLAFEEAQKRGFGEAVRVNQKGEISSACLANIFWLKDEKFYTPSLRTGSLAGTMREFLLENFEISEVETPLQTLAQADTVFLTSAGIGMKRVERFEAHKFEDSPRFSQLKKEFLKLSKSISEIS